MIQKGINEGIIDIDNIIVGHQDSRIGMCLARPCKQQRAVLQPFKFADLEHIRIQLRQGVNKLFKLGLILERTVRVGDRPAANQCAQVFDSFIAVDGLLTRRHGGRGAGSKAHRAHQHNSDQYSQCR